MRLRKQDDGTFHLMSEAPSPSGYSFDPAVETVVVILSENDAKQVVIDSGIVSDEAEVASLKDEIAKLNGMVATAGTNADTLGKQIADQQDQITKLTTENADLNARLTAATQPVSSVVSSTAAAAAAVADQPAAVPPATPPAAANAAIPEMGAQTSGNANA